MEALHDIPLELTRGRVIEYERLLQLNRLTQSSR